jgi:uncharacterized protein (UPF0262 family)
MPLAEIHIDAQNRQEASPTRRLEWDANIRELLDPGELVIREDAHGLRVTVTQQEFVLELEGSDAAPLATVAIPHDDLAEVVREYVDVVRQIASTDGPGGLTRLEALDMAKKVTHDRAGRILKRRCRDLAIDHATARRLFTLLLSLRVDTTRLDGVHGHRFVR